MHSKLRFKYHYHVEIVNEGVLLLSEDKTHVLKGNPYKIIAPYLRDGKYSSDEIAALLQNEMSLAEAYYLIFRLEEKGYIETCNPVFIDSYNAFFSEAGIPLHEVVHNIKNAKVYIKNLTSFSLDALHQSLAKLQITIIEEKNDANFVLVATDHYLKQELENLQKELYQKDVPWLIFKPVGSLIWLGPLFTKGDDESCWLCLKERLKINLLEETYVLRQKKGADYFSTSKSTIPSTFDVSLSLAATETLKWIASGGRLRELKNNVKTLQIFTMETANHSLVKRPQCACCGHTILNQQNEPLILNSQRSIWDDGGNRAVTPETTFKKLEYLISPITGVLKFLVKSEVTPEGVHVYTGGFNFAQCNFFEGILNKNLRTSSSGKGESDLQAKASCICEAVERHCGLFQGNEYRLKSTYQDIKDRAVHPHQLLYFSAQQIQNREELNKKGDIHTIPQDFIENESIEWSPAWSLTKKTFVYLPTAFCYYNYPSDSYRFCYADSNGSSAGNTLEEAILQGLFELIERDCVAVWWYNRIRRPQVDLESFNDDYFNSILKAYREKERDVWVLDITNDLDIPTFVSISSTKKAPYKIILGFGSHLNAKIAIKRAISEMGQSLPLVSSIENNQEVYSETLRTWMLNATIETEYYLKPLDNIIKRKEDYPKLHHDDLLDDIHLCQNILNKQALDILVVNQTRPDIPLKVVKVVVPGLRHFWPQFAPGRLYDVPVKMKWLKEPLKEEDLNPVPMFL